MSIKFRRFLLTAFFVTFTIVSLSPSSVYAQRCPATGPGGTPVCPASGIVQAQEILTRFINISVTLAFMAVTVWLVWGAIKFFITSGGDPKALSHAWMSVTWTFLALVFMALAWLSLKLIVAVTGAPVDAYCLGFKPYCI